MGVPEVKAADVARPAVARFLWETNSELDDPVVDYLSEIVFEEAMQYKNGKSAQAVTENLHLFLPTLRMEGLEARVQGLIEQIRANVATVSKPKDEYRDYWTFSPTSSSASLDPFMKRTLSAVSTLSTSSSENLNPQGSSNSLISPTFANPIRMSKSGRASPLLENSQKVGTISRPPSSSSRASEEMEKDAGGLSAKDLSGTSVESSYVPAGVLSAAGESRSVPKEHSEAKGVPVPVKGLKNLWGEEAYPGLDSLGFTSFNVSESAPGKIETMSLLENASMKEEPCKQPEGGENPTCLKIKADAFDRSPKSPLSDMASPSSFESLSPSKKQDIPALSLQAAQQTGSKTSPSETSDSSSEEANKEELADSFSVPSEKAKQSQALELTSSQLAALSLNPNAAEFVPPRVSKGEKGLPAGGSLPRSGARREGGGDVPAASDPPKELPEEFAFGEESLPRDLLKMNDDMMFGASLARGGSPSTLSGGSHSPGGQSRSLSHPPSPYANFLPEMNRSISVNSMGIEGLPIRRGLEEQRRSHDDLRRVQLEADHRLREEMNRLPRLDLEVNDEGRFFRGPPPADLGSPFPPGFSPPADPLFLRKGSEGSLNIPPSPRGRDPMFPPPFRGGPFPGDLSPPDESPRFALGRQSPMPPHRTLSRDNLRGPPPFGFNRPFDAPPPPEFLDQPPAPFGDPFEAPPSIRGRFVDEGPPRFDRGGFDHPPYPSPRSMRPDFGPRAFHRGFPSPRGPPPPFGFDLPRGGGVRGPPMDEPDPVQVLAAEFPGFPAEGLADIYFSNGCDLALTMEMLTQLEVQEGNSAARRRQPPPPPPSLGMNDFPALAGGEPLFSSHRDMREAEVQDFAAAVRKAAAQNAPNRWGYEKLPPRSNAFPRGVSRGESPPPWLETGDAVAGMYGQLRDEARDLARARNAYFEQATAAYLAGNKALAKQLSAKGQLYNERMKAAHARAGEAIFAERNNRRPGDPPMLDLHGLHVAEAIPILKRELGALKAQAIHTRQRQQVYVVVGTGHHTKGARTPARLPMAIEAFLQEERVQYSEPQPGLLRILV